MALNTDLLNASSDTPAYLGFIAAAVAILFFGSNFVPVKKFETGDGMFFQWVLCASIWFVSLVINAIRHFPTFYPLAMLGGFLWATGNVAVVPIIKTVGLGKGILIWGSFNLMAGWASGRFGWFGLKKQVPHNVWLNYAGMVLCLVSTFIYIFIKSDVQSQVSNTRVVTAPEDDDDPLLGSPIIQDNDSRVAVDNGDTGFIDKLGKKGKVILGVTLSVISGVLYGLNFVPVIYIQNNYNLTSHCNETEQASQNGLDYVFAHFSGIFATSTIYFAVYCAVMRNKPRVYPQVILPAMISGIMWAVADASWFIANDALSEAVSFPIITTGPAIIATLWGVILFKEIKGRMNLGLLGLAFTITATGAVLTGLSK